MKRDGNADPDELSNLFIEITEDLSYARTFYPRRSVRVYLNNLAQSVFNSLYKLKKDPFGNFFKFWTTGLPIEMYRARKHLLAAFLFFAISVLIGVVSIFDDIEFSRVILGDNYVDMTDGFIEDGDPMRVYKLQDEFPMFFEIFMNNIMVAFRAFAFGIIFCIGTGVILVVNGIMVGTFQSYFYLKGISAGSSIFVTSLLTVWIHGTFEMLSFVVAGAAGFVAGMSLLNPGTYTRGQSFQMGIKRGLKIMLGITPFIFIAALLEAYVTRHTDMPDWSRMAIIFGSMGIFIFYFVIYPFIVYRRNEKELSAPPEPVYRPERKIELFKLKNVNEIVADTFLMLRVVHERISKIIWFAFIPLQLLLAYFIFQDNVTSLNYHNLFSHELLVNLIIGGKGNAVFFLLTAVILSMVMAVSLMALKVYAGQSPEAGWRPLLTRFFKYVLVFWPFMTLSLLIMFLETDGAILLMLAAMPLLMYIPVAMIGSRRKGAVNRFFDAFFSFFANIGNAYLLFLITLLVLGGMYLLLNSGIYYFIETIVEWHTITQVDHYGLLISFIHTIVLVIFLQYFFTFMAILFGIFYYVILESVYSDSLFAAVRNFGTGSKTQEKFQFNEE